jgi:hypothetical protein
MAIVLADTDSGDAMRCKAMGGAGALTRLEAVCYLGPRYAVVPWLVAARSDVPLSLAHWPPWAFQLSLQTWPLDTTTNGPCTTPCSCAPKLLYTVPAVCICRTTSLSAVGLTMVNSPNARAAPTRSAPRLNLERLDDRVYLAAQPAPTRPD